MCVKLLPALAGSSRSQNGAHPERLMPALEADENEAHSKVLTSSGVIAFEHNVDLRCVQVEIEDYFVPQHS